MKSTGKTVTFNKSSVFLLPLSWPNNREVFEVVSKTTGLPLDTPLLGPDDEGTQDFLDETGQQPAVEPASDLEKFLWVKVSAMNGMLTVMFDEYDSSYAESDSQAPYDYDEFESLGFMLGGPYWYVKCKTYFKFLSAYNALKKAEEDEVVTLTRDSWRTLKDLRRKYVQNRSGKYTLNIPRTTQTDIKHFLLKKRRKVNVPYVRIYPTVMEDSITLFAWTERQPAALRLRKVIGRKPATKWRQSTENFMYRICETKATTKKVLRRLEKLGYDLYDYDTGDDRDYVFKTVDAFRIKDDS